jgi:isocitrate dehydrogenase
MYNECINFVRENGQFDVSTMGSVANVGLMAQKAEEYGSHDKTFQVPEDGTMRVVNTASGDVIMSHNVDGGDVWRMCQTKDIAVKDWVKLAVNRARATGSKAIFWLDENRAHDASLISKVKTYLKDHDTSDVDIEISNPIQAMRTTCERAKAGKDTISVTGNVLRDYLTDLFPILELGTSAKMLSIVPLLNGGGLFETGAGGSAPKHVQQFQAEGHLRWDSLGEYLAIAVSLEHLGETQKNTAALELSKGLNMAITRFLHRLKSPSRKVKELDNRGSSFYLGLYWADAMASLNPTNFNDLAEDFHESRSKIVDELNGCQGEPVDTGGYYKYDSAKTKAAMCPSRTFNRILRL